MKKAIIILGCLLFALIVLYPAGVLISACFGYTFELISVPAFAIITAAVSACMVVFLLLSKEVIKTKAICVLMAVLTPLSLVSTVFYIVKSSEFLIVASTFISAGCSCFITAKLGKPLALKIVSLALSALMVLPIFVLGSIASGLDDLVQNTVVQTVESPSGKYYVEVVDSDQGALGGDTLVLVYEQSRIDAVLFVIKKKPQRVYNGEWGESKRMQICWKDDSCLVINSVEYEIE